MSSVIFDFDGTIADSLPVVIELFHKWSKREPFNNEEIETLRDMTAKDVIKSVGVPLWRVPSLLARGRRDFTKYIGDIEIFKGVPEVIAELHNSGHELYLMSSNSSENVHKYLKLHNIDQYFEGIYGSGLFNKASAIRRLIKKNKINRKSCYSIGDETRDIDAAKKVGIISIAVDWGFNANEILKSHQPDYLISKPTELLKLVK
jgi:phosphoglycolate phosphatase